MRGGAPLVTEVHIYVRVTNVMSRANFGAFK